MDEFSKKANILKIYCEKCDLIFVNQQKYESHLTQHSSTVYCESCPLDTVIQKITKLFKKH